VGLAVVGVEQIMVVEEELVVPRVVVVKL